LETAFFAPLRDKFLTRKGLIYPQYLLTGTVTGRLSCRNPNMQQIPPEVKGVFSSRHGDGMIVQADFSQIELRVMAELAQEHSMIHVFERDGDIHTATASKIFGIVEDDIEEWQRAIGKRVNFGVLYGMAAAKMTQVANVTYEMAQDFLARYWKAHPSVRRWALSVRREAIVHRRVRGLLGRVRHIPVMDPESKEGQHQLRQAVNFPVQWGAAAITYMALNRVRLALRGMRSDLIATVHDSMVLDCPKEEAVEVCGIVQSICENPGLAEWGLEFTVPLRAKVSMGPTWGDLQEV
jgi:DNA polymerase I-like protein with 3'-5' exonuclease and polymerase domains